MADSNIAIVTVLTSITLGIIALSGAIYQKIKAHVFRLVEHDGKIARVHELVWDIVHIFWILGVISTLFYLTLLALLFYFPYEYNDARLTFSLFDFKITAGQLKNIILCIYSWFIFWIIFLGFYAWGFHSKRFLLPQERLRKEEETSIEEIDIGTFLIDQKCPKSGIYALLEENKQGEPDKFVRLIYVYKGNTFPSPGGHGSYYYRPHELKASRAASLFRHTRFP